MVDWKLHLKEVAKAIQSIAIKTKPLRLTDTLSVCCKNSQRKARKSSHLGSRSLGSKSEILFAHFENEAHPRNKSIYEPYVDFALWQPKTMSPPLAQFMH